MMGQHHLRDEGKTLGYYRDMTRQLWDEARHAMMGEVGFASQGIDWTRARITHNWSLRLNTECTPIERHASSTSSNKGSWPRRESGTNGRSVSGRATPSMATIQDYDWAE